MRRTIWLCALVVLAIPACSSSTVPQIGLSNVVADNENIASRLNRGDWMVNQGTKLWRVMSHGASNRPPQHIGFLEQRQYRQMRGGPEFQMYSVTTRNRAEQIGHVDQMGRAYRYEPQRNGTFRKVSVGTNSMEFNVQAIFDTTKRVTIEAVSERRLAFEALDKNGDGLLQRAETRSFGDRVANADTNGDGVVDFEEFDAVDTL